MKKQSLLYNGLLSLSLFLSVTGAGLGEGSKSKLEIPNPGYFLTTDTVSMLVIRANPEDQGFKSLFDTAWKALSGPRGGGSNWIYKAVLSKIQGGDSNAFSALLPAQYVRVDSLAEKADEPSPTTATTVTGWPGLQAIWYMAQGKDKDGNDYKTVELDDATLILRNNETDPAQGQVLTKLDGTIVNFPSLERAKFCVARYGKKDAASPNKEVAGLLSELNQKHDTYGVLLNRKGSALKMLKWLNKEDYARAESKVGKERIEKIFSQTQSMTWEGDLVSDDEMKFLLKFRTTTPEARQELAAMLKEVRDVLDGYGRAGKMEATGLDNELFVNFQMVGYRGMLERYIERNF